jgi:hypothetical protein
MLLEYPFHQTIGFSLAENSCQEPGMLYSLDSPYTGNTSCDPVCWQWLYCRSWRDTSRIQPSRVSVNCNRWILIRDDVDKEASFSTMIERRALKFAPETLRAVSFGISVCVYWRQYCCYQHFYVKYSSTSYTYVRCMWPLFRRKRRLYSSVKPREATLRRHASVKLREATLRHYIWIKPRGGYLKNDDTASI